MPYTPIFFEVLDKELSIISIWTIFLIIGFVGFAISFFNWRLSILAFLLPIIPIFLLMSEFSDESIYSSIIAEDSTYLPQTYTAMALSFMLPSMGAVINWRKEKQKEVIKRND